MVFGGPGGSKEVREAKRKNFRTNFHQKHSRGFRARNNIEQKKLGKSKNAKKHRGRIEEHKEKPWTDGMRLDLEPPKNNENLG